MGHLNSQKMKTVDLVLFTVVKILQKYCKGHLIYRAQSLKGVVLGVSMCFGMFFIILGP